MSTAKPSKATKIKKVVRPIKENKELTKVTEISEPAETKEILVVVRESMINECYGAWLLEKYNTDKKFNYVRHETKSIDYPDATMLNPKYRYLLIIGGYFSGSYDALQDKTLVTVFSNSSDDIVDVENRTNFQNIQYDPKLFSGFLSWVIQKLKITDTQIITFSNYMDTYAYGYPDNDAICFVNGLYSQEGKTLLDKVLTAYSSNKVEEIIECGKIKREINLLTAKARFGYSKMIELPYKGQILKVRYGVGDSPIVDTLLYFLNQDIYKFNGSSDIDAALLLRYLPSEGSTCFSIRTRKGLDAGNIAKELWNGGGGIPAGGARMRGILFY